MYHVPSQNKIKSDKRRVVMSSSTFVFDTCKADISMVHCDVHVCKCHMF